MPSRTILAKTAADLPASPASFFTLSIPASTAGWKWVWKTLCRLSISIYISVSSSLGGPNKFKCAKGFGTVGIIYASLYSGEPFPGSYRTDGRSSQIPAFRNWAKTSSCLPCAFPVAPKDELLLVHPRDLSVVDQPNINKKHLIVLNQPPGHETALSFATSSSHSNADRLSVLILAERCVRPALMYNRTCSASWISPDGGKRRKSFRSWVRTESDPSKRRGTSFLTRNKGAIGMVAFTGCEVN